MGHHGGARPGAGRKPKADKFAGQIARAEQRGADRLPANFDNLELLADGGFEQIEEKWLPAGLVYIDDYSADNDGRQYKIKVKAFPHLPDDELVMVERKRSIAAPDRQANIYLTDRIMGKPTDRKEHLFPDKPLEDMSDDELRAIVEG